MQRNQNYAKSYVRLQTRLRASFLTLTCTALSMVGQHNRKSCFFCVSLSCLAWRWSDIICNGGKRPSDILRQRNHVWKSNNAPLMLLSRWHIAPFLNRTYPPPLDQDKCVTKVRIKTEEAQVRSGGGLILRSTLRRRHYRI